MPDLQPGAIDNVYETLSETAKARLPLAPSPSETVSEAEAAALAFMVPLEPKIAETETVSESAAAVSLDARVFQLSHKWNDVRLYRTSLSHKWSVEALALVSVSLAHSWNVVGPIFSGSLHHAWRVIPDIQGAFSEDVQMPVAHVSKTP